MLSQSPPPPPSSYHNHRKSTKSLTVVVQFFTILVAILVTITPSSVDGNIFGALTSNPADVVNCFTDFADKVAIPTSLDAFQELCSGFETCRTCLKDYIDNYSALIPNKYLDLIYPIFDKLKTYEDMGCGTAENYLSIIDNYGCMQIITEPLSHPSNFTFNLPILSVPKCFKNIKKMLDASKQFTGNDYIDATCASLLATKQCIETGDECLTNVGAKAVSFVWTTYFASTNVFGEKMIKALYIGTTTEFCPLDFTYDEFKRRIANEVSDAIDGIINEQ